MRNDTDMTEAAAINLCLKHKDPAGFAVLVKLFRKEAYFHALGFMGNSDDASDACQEAFARAFRKMPQMDRLDKFYPWFYCILRNYCFNLISRRRTAQLHEPTITGEYQEQAFDPVLLQEQHEEKSRTWQALGKLEPEFREILILKYFREMDYAGISELL
jgi:RNA polymerase sigma-70 factor (ECF subfamily)